MNNKEKLAEKISEAVESVLSDYYQQEGIKTGDIMPHQRLQWDDLAEQYADLFLILAEQNR